MEHDGHKYIWLNDNATMQKTFAVYMAHGNREERFIRWHEEQAE